MSPPHLQQHRSPLSFLEHHEPSGEAKLYAAFLPLAEPGLRAQDGKWIFLPTETFLKNILSNLQAHSHTGSI